MMPKSANRHIKMTFFPGLALILLIVSLTACQSIDNANVRSKHFTAYLYDDIPEEAAREMISYLEERYRDALDLHLVEKMDQVEIHLWTDHEAFLEKQMEFFGLTQPTAVGFAHNHGLYMMYTGGSMSNAVALHEFIHVVSEWVQPNIRDNPRWLWEAVAVYGSSFPSPNMTVLANVTERNCPSIEDFNADFDENTLIYTFGYSITDFIVSLWGKETLRELIESNGDLSGVLNLSEEEFLKGWMAFSAEKYRG